MGENTMNVAPVLDLSNISKSCPYLSLARQLGLPYGDVLYASEMYSPRGTNIASLIRSRSVLSQLSASDKHLICQLTCAVEAGEIGHGG
jgi:hypothetical protein